MTSIAFVPCFPLKHTTEMGEGECALRDVHFKLRHYRLPKSDDNEQIFYRRGKLSAPLSSHRRAILRQTWKLYYSVCGSMR